MPLLIGVALLFGFVTFFPRTANAAAWVLTLGFIVPVLTLSAGTLAWGIHLAFYGGQWSSWTRDVLLFGLPFGGLIGLSILKE